VPIFVSAGPTMPALIVPRVWQPPQPFWVYNNWPRHRVADSVPVLQHLCGSGFPVHHKTAI
jgi:hypothetical protein